MLPFDDVAKVAAGRVSSPAARKTTSVLLPVVVTLSILLIASAIEFSGGGAAPGLEGTGITEANAGTAPVTRERAIEVASQAAGDLTQNVVPEALFGVITDPLQAGVDEAMRGRTVWVVRYLGLTISGNGPIREDGTPADAGEFHRLHVYVDALTGEWLFSRLEE